MIYEKKFQTVDGDILITLPKTYKDLTLAQFSGLSRPLLSLLDQVSILTGIATDRLYNIRRIEELIILKDAIETLITDMDNKYDSDAIPKKLRLPDGKHIDIDIRIGIQPVGAFITVDEMIKGDLDKYQAEYGEQWKEYARPSMDTILGILAHFFYCPVTKLPWNINEVDKFQDFIKDLKAVDSLPIAKAFFLPYLNLEVTKNGYFQRLGTHYQNWRELKSLKSLVG